MKHTLGSYQQMLEEPLSWSVRFLLIVSIFVLLPVFRLPLWTMSFESNQYPDPLRLAIHIDHLEGQLTEKRDDLREINSLNHYIGMRPLLESDFSEFLWMPFVIGIFGLIILRAVGFGNVRDLIDIVVLFAYFGLFSLWVFWQRLYDYGHQLSPEAAIDVEPFMPPIFGRVRVANFWVESYPGGASYALGVFGLILVLALVLALRWARLQSRATADEA